MKEDNSYDLNWEENDFSGALCEYINEQKITTLSKIDVSREHHLSNSSLKNGKIKADELNRIDFRMMNWSFAGKVECYGEAKNLAENDWIKRGGTKVEASKLRGRYINTGIDKIVSSEYPENSFLIGYVLQGDIDKNKEKINNLLIRRKRTTESLSVANPINDYNHIFQSKHDSLKIIHLFLKF